LPNRRQLMFVEWENKKLILCIMCFF
jgi:hypothetical protein